MNIVAALLALLMLVFSASASSQQCAGGSIQTHDAYQYGRFETRMQSAQGDGIVSSFFLYNIDLGCNWPAELNEIDIEMTGNRLNSVQFTTHHPHPTTPWSVTSIEPTAFNPHAGMHDYAFEWEPGIVRWFVDGNLVYSQGSSIVNDLIYPMRILMNLWAADSPGWVGNWDPSVMPAQSSYDYVRYYAYTPGTGNAGTNNNFTLSWTDDFTSFDASRWEASEFGGFGGNFCTFVSDNVTVSGGELTLSITDPLVPTNTLVSFSVNVTALNLAPSDIIYLNGTFNNWCGTCAPMSDTDGDGIWETTISLPPGKHEYLFTKNGWAEVGGAPLGSACDFQPCDMYANYGVIVPHGSGPIDTDTVCWSTCNACAGIDSDNDGIDDTQDNCTVAPNSLQMDTDGDGHGNVCDGDFDNSCSVNFFDLASFKTGFGGSNPMHDLNESGGTVNFFDLIAFKSLLGSPPGPSPAGSLCNP